MNAGSNGGAHSADGVDTARRFFAGTAATYDLTVNSWTFGLDRLWKRKIIGKIPPAPKRIIDQACGTGILTVQMARRFPACHIFGVDLHWEYLLLAERKAGILGLGNVDFVRGLAEEVVFKGQFDCITSSYLAKYANLESLMEGAATMLRKGGVLVMHDFSYPRIPLVRRILGAYFRVMQTLGSRTFPEWQTVFHELEGFLKKSRWIPELISSLRINEFGAIRAERLSFGIATVVSAVKR